MLQRYESSRPGPVCRHKCDLQMLSPLTEQSSPTSAVGVRASVV